MIVRVAIENKDRMVGAMVKALAVEVAGFQAVKGTTKEFLSANGHYDFEFPSKVSAAAFCDAIAAYIPENRARVTIGAVLLT
jgi:hypothetical protein